MPQWIYSTVGPLTLLKPDCAVINACRGEVTNNDALLTEAQFTEAQSVRKDHWCWMSGPMNQNLILRLIPHTDIASAHIAGHSIEGKARGTEMLYQAFCQQLGLKPSKDSGTSVTGASNFRAENKFKFWTFRCPKFNPAVI